MTKLTRRELEELLSEFEEEPPQNPNQRYRFSKRWERKYFPLLFPKSEADEIAIRRLAAQYHIDYYGLIGKLKETEALHFTRQNFKSVLNDFKAQYQALVVLVMVHHEQNGIVTIQYGIQQPKAWKDKLNTQL